MIILVRLTNLPVHLDGEDPGGVAVVADLVALEEVADAQLPRRGLRDHGHQAALEQPLSDVHLLGS